MDGGAQLYPRGAESTGIKKAFPSNTFQYFWRGLISGGNLIGEQGWRKNAEHSPPISVARVQFAASTPCVD